MPNGWLIGADGRSTTDASNYPAFGTLSPAAGHKGYGIGLLIEVLAGIVTGAEFTWRIGSWMTGDPSVATGHGAAFLAIDVGVMMPPDDFARRMQELIVEIHSAPRADGVERVLIPGELEWERHQQAMVTGIALPRDVVASLGNAAAFVDLDLASYVR